MTGIITAAYISAAILFILALGGLSDQERAKRAIWYGVFGMALAMLATAFSLFSGPISLESIPNIEILLAVIAVGAVAGLIVAFRVQMTGMPQLVAILHSFVGLAAVFIGLNADIVLNEVSGLPASPEITGFAARLAEKDSVEIMILKVEVLLGIFIGAITFTGSVVAYGKLAGLISGLPRQLPGGHILNLIMAVLCVVLGAMYLAGSDIWTIIVIAVIAGLIGWHLIMGIGGADMPVVVSMLNSYSGWAAAAIG
ncbi:MAG: NAD(P)(+) transhydrogenase (Re/Si-specific) subunit beta, partial [Rhodobacteraceae bacterium]|nr:NAD(P)(+) transhydrogenase (Re/Si-specific) subunit beta [Paracoccaceae bacterium]